MSDDLQTARKRIAAAYDAATVREAGQRLIDVLGDHLQHVQQGSGPVLNWRPPAENVIAAQASLHDIRIDGSIADRLTELAKTILSRGQNLHHPHYVGHQVPASIPL